VAGFFENLLRQGSQAGLGYMQGQREGQGRQAAQAAQQQREELELALIQAQIERTGRQDVTKPAAPDPLAGLFPDPNDLATAGALTGTGRTRFFEQKGLLEAEPEEPEAPDMDFQRRVEALGVRFPEMSQQEMAGIASSPTAFAQAIRSQEPDAVDPTSRFVAARQRALAAAGAVSKAMNDPLTTLNPEMLGNTLRLFGYESIEELSGDMENFGITAEDVQAEPDVDPLGRAEELRAQGLSVDEIIAQMRKEGLVGG